MILRTSLVLLAVLLVSAPASAQNQPFAPVAPYVGDWGQGNALQGNAAGIDSIGQLFVYPERARIERERAAQARLDTRKRTLNEILYEKAMTPTYGEEKALDENKKVQRMMTTPSSIEIAEGKTLNQFLPFIQHLVSKGAHGPPVPLDPYALSRIAITMAENGPNVSLIRQEPISWPLPLQNPVQQKLAAVLKVAVAQATKSDLQPAIYNEVVSLQKQLSEDFTRRFQADEASAGDFLLATPFLETLEANIAALGQPGVNRLLDGSYSARGSNVPELVAYMIGNGLTFAPAAPGNEAAYHGLHNAFVSYIAAAQASSGFRIQTKLKLPTNLR